jgi:hypothetical protein
MNFFAAASGRGAGGGRGVGGAPAMATPREPCSFTFHRSRVVVATIPYNTARAAAIRTFMAARILNDANQRVFVFRGATGWTSVAANSTPEVPAVTCDPAEIARKVTSILTQCPDVSTVTLTNESGQQITAEDVSNMNFDALEDHAAASAGNATEDVTVAQLQQLMRDNYSKLEEIAQDQKRDVIQLKSDLESKLGYIIDVLEKNARDVDPNRRDNMEFGHVDDDDDDQNDGDAADRGGANGEHGEEDAAAADADEVVIQEVDETPIASPPAGNRRANARGSGSNAEASSSGSATAAPANATPVTADGGRARKRRTTA